MKKIIYVVMIGFSLSSLTSCKKDKEQPDTAPSASTKADDATARTELDKAYDDVESVYNSQDYAGARSAGVVLPCGSVTLNSKNFTIQYNGVNCGSRVLSGSIDVTLVTGTKFTDKNAKLKVVFKDYKVLYNANKQSIVYNGTAYVINSTGGTLVSLFTSIPNVTVVHKVRGSLQLTFDSTGTGTANVTRNWNLFRKKTYENIPGTPAGITLTVSGDTTIDADTYIPGTYAKVSEYGIGREGYKFVAVLPTDFRWENCGTTYDGPYILKQGQVNYTSDVSSNTTLALLGISKLTYTATAGYRYTKYGQYPFDGTCSSSGYKLDFAGTNAAGDVKYSTTSYQPY